MKKLILILIAILLCPTFLFACGGEDKYWEATASAFTEILGDPTSPKYAEIFETPLTYTQRIESEISYTIDNSYPDLLNYDYLLKQSLTMTKKYYTNFAVAPLKNVKTQQTSLVNHFRTLENKINIFKAAKLEFENSLDDVIFLRSENAKQHLKNYKNAFSTLIVELLDLNQKFVDTYSASFNKIEDIDDPEYFIYLSQAEIINAYSLIAIKENNNLYVKDTTVVYNLEQLQNALAQTSFKKDNYDDWKAFYDAFLTEKELMKTALNQVDYHNYDSNTATNEEKIAYNKINSFYTYITLFTNQTIKFI